MATWKLANGVHANFYRAACLEYCLAHVSRQTSWGSPRPSFESRC
jgi:hypothetical protein